VHRIALVANRNHNGFIFHTLEQTVATVTFKNIPDDLYEKLKEAAAAHHRSINSELINCLESILHPRKIEPMERLTRFRNVRLSLDESAPGLDDLQQAIEDGRR